MKTYLFLFLSIQIIQTFSRRISNSLNPLPSLHTRTISADVFLKNGQLAQHLNHKFLNMTLETDCLLGDKACINGGFAQCVHGQYVNLGCAPPTKCFELPLLLKPGTVPGCTTPEDAASRIANSGAKGGVTGNGSTTNASSITSTSSPAAESNSTSQNEMISADMTDSPSMASNMTVSPITTSLNSSSSSLDQNHPNHLTQNSTTRHQDDDDTDCEG